MNSYELVYRNLVGHVLDNGEKRPSRAGPTRGCFGTAIRIGSLKEGFFPILTGRQMFYKPVFGELTAFLCGAEQLQTYKRFGCNYWDANAGAWHENANQDPAVHRVGKIYGAQWRKWTDERDSTGRGLDQMDMLIEGLKKDSFGRRHLLTAYNPAELDMGCLPPCHLMTQFNVTTGDYLDCAVYMRSVDLCLGLPSDVILYAALLLLVAQQTGKKPGMLTFFLGDTHIYENHVDTWFQYVERPTHELPTWILDHEVTVDNFTPRDLILPDYKHEEVLKYEFNV